VLPKRLRDPVADPEGFLGQKSLSEFHFKIVRAENLFLCQVNGSSS